MTEIEQLRADNARLLELLANCHEKMMRRDSECISALNAALASKCVENRSVAIASSTSRRDSIAASILSGLLSNPGGPLQANGMSGWDFCNCKRDDVIKMAVIMADVLIESLDETEPKGGK